MTAPVDLAALDTALGAHGLAALGLLAPGPEDGAPAGVRTLALIGPAGPGFWDVFARAPEPQDGERDPLDRWSRRIGTALAERLGAVVLFPFGGPPYAPFLRWALASGRAWPSPLGMLIHAERGLWVSYRFALGFAAPLASVPAAAARPCDACVDRPCLAACPVDAFGAAGYDTAACAAHLRAAAGRDCLETGCRARRACPVGGDARPIPEQAAFHMAAFLRARSEPTA